MLNYLRIVLLFLAVSLHTVEAQNVGTGGISIQGNVTDTDGNLMPGVFISLKSGSKVLGGTATDNNGKYSVVAQSESDSIVFSFIGYQSQSLVIGKKRVFNIKMNDTSANLGEVVVTGYQTISRERATGSFAKVTSETLSKQRLSNLSTLLDGQVAGFTNGLLRGTTSMHGATSPLYVVDGFPIENVRFDGSTGKSLEGLPDLNMEDIESITVLKDAAATSIYGARAANGVVVIVTKKASRGKTQVSFSSTFTVSPYSYYKKGLTNSADIIDIEKEWAASNSSLQGANAAQYAQQMLKDNIYPTQGISSILNYYAGNISDSELQSRLNTLSQQGYSYYDDLKKYTKRNPFYQQYNLSIGKTSDANTFRASVTYRNNKQEDLYTDDQSVGINISNSLDITKWLKLDLGTYNYYQDQNMQTYKASSPEYKYLPYDVLKNADGTNYTSLASSRLTNDKIQEIEDYGLYNMDITPLDEIGRNLGKIKSFQNRTYARLNIKLTDWLNVSSMFQYEYGSDRYSKLSSKDSYSVRDKVNSFATVDNKTTAFNLPYGNIYNTVNFYSKAYTSRQQIDVNKTFNEKHVLTALVGNEIRENKTEFSNNTLYNYDPDILTYTLIDAAKMASANFAPIWGGRLTTSDVASSSEVTNRFVSFYGNAGYTYDEKYMLTGSLRWDRSNLWGTASKYQNKPIWSTGLAWNLEKESFMTLPWVDRLKLRISYGIAGNIAKDAAPYMVAYYTPNTTVGGTQGTISTRPNPSLSWEKTTTTNIATDFALFGNRLNGTIEYYNKSGKDLLANVTGNPTEGYGYSTYKINNGEMNNRGVEITLSGEIIRTKDFGFSSTFVYGYNKNKVTYVNVEAPVYYLQLDYPKEYPRIGNPYQAIYAYKWAGLSSDGLPQVYNEEGEAVSSIPSDLEAIHYAGTTVPVHSGSFSSNFRYKNFDLSFMLIYEAGHKMRNTFLPTLSADWSSAAGAYITSAAATNKKITNRWRNPGDEAHTDIPRILFAESPNYSSSLYTIYANADINVISASNVRLSNIALSYSIPSEICTKAFLRNARVQFNIENLMTIAESSEAKYLLGGYNSPNYVLGLYLNF